MLSRRYALVLSLGVFLFTSCLCLNAQSTYGSVSGTVTDTSGAAVSAANVTLTNVGTSEKRTEASGDNGQFTFVNLFQGEYRIDIEKQGFKHFAHPGVIVEVQQDTHIDAAMTVGQVSETVEVTGEVPLLQTETSSLGQVVEQRKADELPLNGRNIFNLITVSPAAVAQGGSGGSPVGQNPFSWGNYQVGGSFANQGAQYLDGQPLNIGYINLPIIIPTQDSVGEFKVQYNNLGAEWGKFSGGVVNLSTKSGTNAWHGSVYEYFRNKVLNANEYFNKQDELAAGTPNSRPPWTQNQYGFQVGGPVVKDKTFFYVSWEQYRQRTGSPFTTTVPVPAMLQGDFSSLCTAGFNAAGVCNNIAQTIFDPFSVGPTGANPRTPYSNAANGETGAVATCPGNCIPSTEFSTAGTTLWQKYYPAPNLPGTISNYLSVAPAGGNTNEFVARGDQNVGTNTRLFGRFSYFGLLDLPVNPFGTGLCLDRCAENYHSKLLVFDVNHSFTPTTILDVNFGATRFVYARQPILAGYDLTKLGWPSSYNSPPASIRTPPTPEFTYPNDVGHTQGNSAIGDHNTQYNITPAFTLIRGKHTIQTGAQFEYGLDNYFQTNIASGAFGFQGNWTSSSPTATDGSGFGFADFLLGVALNQGSFAGNQTEGVAQVPAQSKGLQVYRALFVDDTWHVTPKFTANLGLRYELQGTWSEAYNRLSYFDPTATNATVTGCPTGSCPGDAFLVQTGRNGSRNNIPMGKKAFSPRLGFAYALDQKTSIRGGYGIFFIPNYVSFGLNPDNDVVNLASTDFTATTNSYLTPFATLDGYNCTIGAALTAPTCVQPGPFGAGGIILPPGRNFSGLPATPSVSSFVASQNGPTLAPYYGTTGHNGPEHGYVEQWNFDVQRQLPAGFFADVAYAASHGVHLEQYSTNVNQIADSFVAQAASQYNAAAPGCAGNADPIACANAFVTIDQPIANPLVGSPNATLALPTLSNQGQLDRPYPEYLGMDLAGYGCCGSSYNSLQVSVNRRFQGGGTLLVAYTNEKLMSNTDTLTSWLESATGGVPGVQDWNNLAGERSLSAQDVSQRLIISYVLDLPFGHGRMFASNLSGVSNGLVSGWGIDGITTFQRGFPLKINWAGPSTSLESGSFGVANIRPDVVPGCNKKAGGGSLTQYFNTSCFAPPPQWGYGTESRVDSSLRGPGINNFDFAIFKDTHITERTTFEFRTEFFNLFNHPYFAQPATGYSPTANGFGAITETISNGAAANFRLIQFAGKFIF